MKTLRFAALAAALLIFTGCPGPVQEPPAKPPETPTTAKAGESVALAQTASFVALATMCNGVPIEYQYSGTTTPNYNPAIDGSIDQSGNFRAPVCGSALLGSTVTVVGSCRTSTALNWTVANITVGSELVTGVTVVAADVAICGSSVCRARTPSTIITPACPANSPTTIQFYARVDATCGSVFAPFDPATVTPTPPVCPSTVSP